MTKKHGIADSLRERILGAIDSGALRAGDRLPSSRALAAELRADPRVIAAAYRALAAEWLVEIRPKSGAYLAAAAVRARAEKNVPLNWLVNVFVDGICRGVTLPELGTTVLDHAEPRRIRGVVVADTLDQCVGICTELKRDYAVNACHYHMKEIRTRQHPADLARATVIFAADDCAGKVRNVARAVRRPMIPISLRADLFDAEWLSLMDRELYVIATDPHFIHKLTQVMPPRAQGPHVRLLLFGRDDLSTIPRGAPTYVTESARRAIGKMRLPGRTIRPRRLFSDDTVRNIVSFIVAHNSERA